jgi:hypothetical protein
MFSRLPEADQQAILRQANKDEFERYIGHAHMKLRVPMRQERAGKQAEAPASAPMPSILSTPSSSTPATVASAPRPAAPAPVTAAGAPSTTSTGVAASTGSDLWRHPDEVGRF